MKDRNDPLDTLIRLCVGNNSKTLFTFAIHFALIHGVVLYKAMKNTSPKLTN